MAAVTIGELRHLARLFREGVDGARERLEGLANENGDELADVLRFPRKNLARLADADDIPALVAATIEGSLRLQREAVARARRASARGLAETLASLSEHRDDGSILLHGPLLAQILLLWGPGWIVFGDWGSVDAARVRAILRECRGVTSHAVVLTHESLFLYYEAPRSRGVIRLHLQHVVIDADALQVPAVTVATPLLEVPQRVPAEHRRPPARAHTRAPHYVLAGRLLEAALALALGDSL